MAHDKRRFVRIPVRVDFFVDDATDPESGQLFFASRNVSLGGAFLSSDYLLERGARVRVRFALPGASAPIEAEAAVAWVSDDGDEDPGMGIEFTRIGQESVLAIAKFIEKHGAARS